MTQILSLVAGSNKSYDHQLTALHKAILAGSCVLRGIGNELQVVSGFVKSGSAFIFYTRTNGESGVALFQNSADVIMATAGLTKKVWIEIDLTKLDDGSSNAADGSGIASIGSGANWPSSNPYIPLATITGGVISDARVFTDTHTNIVKDIWGVSSNGTDTYSITPSPAVTALKLGQVISFYADVPNVGACGLIITTIPGTPTYPIKKRGNVDLADGDIAANGIFVGRWDGTNIQMISAVANIPTISIGGLSENTNPSGNGYLIREEGGSQTKIKESNINRTKPYTISGGVIAGDVVYPSAANTAKTLYPSGMATVGTSPTTAPTTANLDVRNFPLSVGGKYLQITGGCPNVAGPMRALVRNMNALETDFSNATETAIYATGNGVRGFDVCKISTDKFLIVFQADTGGVGVGIKTVVISIDPSNGNVTVGSIQGIESVGQLTGLPGVATVDTDKACIFYQKDSDSDLYAQVLTVSTTTINTNTPLLVKAFSGSGYASAVQLSTNTMAVVYQDNSTNAVYGRIVTVSSTTPALGGTEQTILGSTGASAVGWTLKGISATKLCFAYSNNSPINDTIYNIAISGNTMTPSSGLALGSDRNTAYYGMEKAGKNYLIFYHRATATTSTIRYLDISGTAPVSVSTQTVSHGSITVIHAWSVVKVAPWTYLVQAQTSDSDYILKLTPISSVRIGVAEGTIADAATGNIAKRFQNAILSSLTVGSKYYADDDGQITTNSSLTAPEVGFADSTTNLILI